MATPCASPTTCSARCSTPARTAPRRRAHLALGEALERVGAIHAAELAAHFAAAGDSERAVRYGRLAAAESTARLGFDDAVSQLEQALHALDATAADPVTRLGLVADLADAQRTAGRLTEAAATYREAEALARHIGDRPARTRAAIGLHQVGIKTGPSPERDAQVALLESVATALAPDADIQRAHVTAALARTLMHSMSARPMARARPVAEEAVALARRSGDPDALVDALLALHDASWAPGTSARRLRVLDELDRLDRADRADLHLLRAEALLELGDPACHASLDEFCAAAERAGHTDGALADALAPVRCRAHRRSPRPRRRSRPTCRAHRPAHRRCRRDLDRRHPTLGTGPLHRRARHLHEASPGLAAPGRDLGAVARPRPRRRRRPPSRPRR